MDAITPSDWPEQRPFTREGVERALSKAANIKAHGLVHSGAVSDLRWLGDKGMFTAQVQGTMREPYAIRVAFAAGKAPGAVEIKGHCTCPMGHNCKHVGAVLFEILNRYKASRGQQGPSQAPPAPKPAAAKPPRPSPPPPATLAPPIAQWLAELDQAQRIGSESYEEGLKHRLIYVLRIASAGRPFGLPRAAIAPSVAMLKADGSFSTNVAKANLDPSPHNAPRYLRAVDQEILRQLRGIGAHDRDHSETSLAGSGGFDILRMAAQTGRLRLGDVHGVVLREAEPIETRLDWEISAGGDQFPTLAIPETAGQDAWFARLAPPILVDPVRQVFHPVRVPGIESATLLETFLNAPMLDFQQAQLVASQLDNRAAAIPVPSPRMLAAPRPLEARLQPVLRLFKGQARAGFQYWQASQSAVELSMALISFRYDSVEIRSGDPRTEIITTIDGALRILSREQSAEKSAVERVLRKTPLGPLSTRGFHAVLDEQKPALTCQTSDDWLMFMNRIVPGLRAEGWLVEISDDFPFHILSYSGSLSIDIEEGSGIDWIELRLGTLVGDERLDLVPMIARLIAEGALANFEQLVEDASLMIKLDERRYLPIPIAVIRPILENLMALFGSGRYDAAANKIRLGRYDLVDLSALEAAGGANLVWKGGEALRTMARSLREFGQIPVLAPPEELKATLRPYQGRGVDWLQFLGQAGFGGILADDMGLGKTVQTLAHLLHEKAAGRLGRPALLVCPTSVIGNWEREAAHFAPSLRLLSLHGLDRARNFERIGGHDLVLSTYPLISRDHETLKAVDWSLIVFDEAQMIKNPEAVTTKLVATLDAGQKIALTGTPLENHLGELWSLFNVLAPGYLGDKTSFTRLYRTPIEKKGDTVRLGELTRRIRPFMLRRTKAEVAADLPPKVEMPEVVSFEGPQRTLYESVRLAMHERVREAIATQGLKRSTIVILDALLKMRQVCCDPRLLKLAKTPSKAGSAKLDRLLEMVPSLIDAGRRILLFSQFTSMLALIEAELAKARIPYVLLTGDTKDRRTPIDQFQSGRIPLFLISLRAGGSGLNLTAADTVIHYDPWWNPAVEAQATDRAHRIGQTRTVFVHKLIAENTVEEKIEMLKTRKATLASGILDPGGSTALDLTEADIDALFG